MVLYGKMWLPAILLSHASKALIGVENAATTALRTMRELGGGGEGLPGECIGGFR